jgi:hypothetical protein
MKFAAGDRSCPNFITPGATQTELVPPELWARCRDVRSSYQPQDLWRFAEELIETKSKKIRRYKMETQVTIAAIGVALYGAAALLNAITSAIATRRVK